jgi:DNA (cytosine-5)-methyltransferase 1
MQQDKSLSNNKKKNILYPEIIDLFSGCGGLSYGFHLEGLNVVAGIEKEKNACYTASYNLHWKHGKDEEHICADIKDVCASTLDINLASPKLVIGGPPCQAYSRIGRSKIKSLGEHRFGLNDNRAFLYKEFVRMCLEVNAEAVVMENVPESVNFVGQNIPETVSDMLEEYGYNSVWTILNAANFGVPQTRERVFVIAIKKKYGEVDFLPEPTHIDPSFNEVTFENRYQRFAQYAHFKKPMLPQKCFPSWTTVDDALSDLPGLFPNSNSKYTLEKVNTLKPYQTPPLNNYQHLMRKTLKGQILNQVTGHSFRRTLRDFRIFEKMEPNDDYRNALSIAINLFEEVCVQKNISKSRDYDTYSKLKKKYVPPYDATKFHGKWKKLDPCKPSHTLVAHLGTDTYSHIHPYEPRGISVREAARLQSFPDDFVFNVSMGSAFTQIGNAVPPLLAKGVAKAVIKNLNKTMARNIGDKNGSC